MFITLLVSLYTSRIILNALGVTDYGIYNVVGGIVAIFGFLNSAMVSSTQRYMSYELGRNNVNNLKIVYSTSLIIHIIISIFIIIFAETIGLWLIYNKLSIPESRFEAALYVYHISIITFILNILRVPDNSLIIAFEKMSAFAYISIADVILKLIIVLILPYYNYDKLILYAILLMGVTLSTNIIYRLYCNKKIQNSKITTLQFKKEYFIKMFSFSGWSLFGNLSSSLSKYGINILLNVFFGPIVNAARGLSYQVQAAVINFSSNFIMAVNPQIIKSYASGDIIYLNKLINSSSKLSYYLLFIVSLPIILNSEYILKIWLGSVPEYSSEFVNLIIINSLIDVLSSPIQTAVQATGRIKGYQIIIGGILLLNLPISYIILKLYGNVYSPFYISIILSLIAMIARYIVIKRLTPIDIKKLIIDLYSKIIIITTTSICLLVICKCYDANSLIDLIKNSIVSVCITMIIILLFGLNNVEKKMIYSKFKFPIKLR